jgi:two-component system OmpR family response regulator
VPDVLVVDIGLPDADGRDVTQALRARGIQAPVLFLTARDALVDRIAGFDAGGDDYLSKPFEFVELVARLHALIRRSGGRGRGGGRGSAARPGLARAGARRPVGPAHADGVPPARTPARAPGRGGAAARPLRAGWPHGAIVRENTLDAYVARLRRKLKELGGAPEIVTVQGVGYRME